MRSDSRARRSRAGNTAPSTTRRSSRRARIAAAACGRLAQAAAIALRAVIREGASEAGRHRDGVLKLRIPAAVSGACSGNSAHPHDSAVTAAAGNAPFYMSRLHRREPDHAAVPAAAYDIDCRRCPRLAHFLDQVLAANPGYFCRPVPPFGDMSGAPGHRRARAGHARRQRQRQAVHRRLRGHPALCDLAQVRLREPGAVAGRRRRPATGRRPDHQRGQVPAAGQQAAARGDQELQCAISRPSSARCPTARRFSRSGRIAHDATLRALGLASRAYPFAHGAEHALPGDGGRCSCSTAITAAATTPTRGA